MSAGFGFSTGDFIAAVELVSTVLNALRESGGSSTEYQALISQLYTLETALLRVKRLDLDDVQHAEAIALRQAASQCQRTIDAFLAKIAKYQPSLRAGGSGNTVRDTWRKVKWALCRKEDVVRLRADLLAHTESIDMLLMTVHMDATRNNGKRNQENYRTLMGLVQDSYFGCMQKMAQMIELVSTGLQQGRELLEVTASIIRTNVQIFHIVLNIQNIITRIPGRIERQRPVYLIDALGEERPFFLEFITSVEAFIHVLQDNFRNIEIGAAKVKRGEFAIQDLASKRDINLTLPWETCFHPGQYVAMSMIFHSAKPSTTSCPICHASPGTDFAEDEDIECGKCKMIYRRSVLGTSAQPIPVFLMTDHVPSNECDRKQNRPALDGSSSELKAKRSIDEDDEMALFRRVRIKTSMNTAKDPHLVDSDISKNLFEDQGSPDLHTSLPRHIPDHRGEPIFQDDWNVRDERHLSALFEHFGTNWQGLVDFTGGRITVRNKMAILAIFCRGSWRRVYLEYGDDRRIVIHRA